MVSTQQGNIGGQRSGYLRRIHRGRSALVFGTLLLGVAVPGVAQGNYTVFTTSTPSSESVVSAKQPVGKARVTLIVGDSSIAYIVRTLVHQAHMRLSYNIDDPTFSKRMSAHLVDSSLMGALAEVLHNTGLTAVVAADGETIVVRAPTGAMAVTRQFQRAVGEIVGRVTDSASGQGLSGAAVKVAGTKLSTVTSDSGKFTLKAVPAGDQVLSVRLFGYKPVDRSVTVADSQRAMVRIVMVSVPTVLSGVVTTATGTQRKIEVGNDITTLNVDSIRQIAPITSVTDLLETRVPGLTIVHSDGVPGDPSRLRLRGVGSVQLNNDPIVVIDGVRVYASQSDPRNQNLAPDVTGGSGLSGKNPNTGVHGYTAPSPLDQIDPANIESIEVLKGPSATAIYGSDAGNGVIVITTKHGQAGPVHWSAQLSDGVNWLPGKWPTYYYRFGSTGIYFLDANYDTGQCPWYQLGCTVDSVVAFQALNDPKYTIFGHGSDQAANLTISGGHPDLTYSLTASGQGQLGYLKLPTNDQAAYDSAYGAIPKGLVRPDNYTTWGVAGTLTAMPDPTLRITLQGSLYNGVQQRSSLENAVTQLDQNYYSATNVPVIQRAAERATDNALTSTNTVALHWQPLRWLPIDGTGGISTEERTDKAYIPYGVCITGTPQGCIYNNYGDTTGEYGLGRGLSHNQTFTGGTAIPAHFVTLAFGGNLYSQSTNDFSITTNSLGPGVTTPTTFQTCNIQYVSGKPQTVCVASPSTQSTTASTTYGWYVEPRLNFASRFFVAPGFRLDGGSGGSHATYNQGGLGGLSAFPKMDFSYVAVDRQGKQPLWGVLTLLRPRAALGIGGTQPYPQDRLQLFNATPASLAVPGEGSLTINSGCGYSSPAVCLVDLGNTQLRPERSQELEGGFDATLWGGRVSLTYTQYNKTRKDAILSIPVAPDISGYAGQQFNIEKNIGEIRNTGTELTANAFLIQTRAVSWNVGVNLSNDNNMVVHLNPGQSPICLGDGTGTLCSGERIVAGYPLFGIWGRPIVAFADSNHDGVIEPAEIRLGDSSVYLGIGAPKYQLNLTTDLTLLNGHLGIHATFAYQNGLTQYPSGSCYGNNDAFVSLPNQPNTPLATEAAIVAAGCGPVGGGYTTNYGVIQTVNTFRFNDLSINYQLPRTMSSWFRVPRATVAVQGSNLALHTNYRGLDPDVNAFSTVNGGDQTEDAGQIPEPRTWRLQLTLGN